MAKRKRYDDKFRANAVLLLEAAGYPDTKGALTRVANNVGVPAMTISRWYKRANNPPPNEIVNEKRPELIDLIRKEIYKVLDTLPKERDDADYRTLVTGLAILIDKLQLLEGKATERIELMDEQERSSRIADLLGAARARRDRPDTERIH
jgi:transposase-like protein